MGEPIDEQADLGRVPPQDVAAEQSVLGAMMMSKDAIADVVEIIKARDFYRPAHEMIYNAIIELYGRGEPADAVTVADQLGKTGELNRAGGHLYLVELIQTVAIAANAAYYAEIVHEKAVLRRLVEASIKIAQLGYSGTGDVTDIVDAAEQAVYEVSEGRTSDDYKPLSVLIEPTIDEMEAIASRSGMSGVPTGFSELDDLTNGLHPGQMIIIAARPAMGKALALDTELATPTGWTTMGEVQVGDLLLDAEGRPTRVVAATEVLVDRPCYRITFDDGTTVVADAQHEWRATSRADRRASSARAAAPRFTPEAVSRIMALASLPSEQLTMGELVGACGAEFRSPLRRITRHSDTVTRLPRPVSGPERAYMWRTPTYDRHAVAERLLTTISGNPAPSRNTVTTQEMAQQTTLAGGRANWAVPLAAPIQGCHTDLPVDPYLLGVWLGDGHTASARITTADPDIVDELRRRGYRATAGAGLTYTIGLPTRPLKTSTCLVCGASFTAHDASTRTCSRACGARIRGRVTTPAACPTCGGHVTGPRECRACRAREGSVQGRLRALGVLGNKHIPPIYLRASTQQRLDLLRGLLDTDGTVTSTGSVQFTVTDARLASDARDLVATLGLRCSVATRRVAGSSPERSIAYNLNFTAGAEVFHLQRKKDALIARQRPGTPRLTQRYIRSIEPVDSVPVRCVQVDNSDHLYLCTRSMVPTHNSTLALDFARAAAIKNKLTTAFFSLEMSKSEIVMRLLSAEAQVALNHIRNGKMTDEDWQRVVSKTMQVSEAPFFIDDSPNLTMMEIRAKARRLKQRHDLKMVIIDYMQLMSSGKKVESRQLEVSEFSRQIKLLAKELEIPVIALSQLNRGPEQRTDKKPMMSDLRESGSLEQDADMVILLHRDDVYDKDSPRAGEADLIVAKHRNGPTGTIVTAFQGHYSRFVDMHH